MYNLRYHLASLVAVFLALALGLLLGSVVAERGYLDEQQAALVEGLQRDFEDLRSTNDVLRQEYERDHDFALQVAEVFSSGTLEGARILVVTDALGSEALAAVNAAVGEAGGSVVTAVFESAGLGLDAPEVRVAVAGLISTSTPLESRDLSAELVGSLASELTSPVVNGTAYLDVLIEAGVLELDDWDPATSLGGAVVVAAYDGVPDGDIIRLAKAIDETGLPVMGAEVSWLDEGVVSAAVDIGLSAVDHVDLPQGALSLAMILSDRAEGHFGLRDGATGTNPPLIP